MQILEFPKFDPGEHFLGEIRKSDWRAAPFLAELIETNTFHEKWGRAILLLLTDGDRLVSFVTLSEKDCIDDPALSPWAGFVYTFPEYRGHRYAGLLLSRCEEIAAANGAKQLFVCTDHVGLYEKYGFSYMESRTDIFGGESRIYKKVLKEE